MPHQARLKSSAIFPYLPEMRKTLSRLGIRMTQVEERLEPAVAMD
jgi:UDP-3-O-[3-hydroxymyristoyl] glucosamine N-acyltransferase